MSLQSDIEMDPGAVATLQRFLNRPHRQPTLLKLTRRCGSGFASRKTKPRGLRSRGPLTDFAGTSAAILLRRCRLGKTHDQLERKVTSWTKPVAAPARCRLAYSAHRSIPIHIPADAARSTTPARQRMLRRARLARLRHGARQFRPTLPRIWERSIRRSPRVSAIRPGANNEWLLGVRVLDQGPGLAEFEISFRNGYAGMIEAFRARANERRMAITSPEVAQTAGLTSYYIPKLLTPSKNPVRRVGMISLGPLLGVLGAKLVLMPDPEAEKLYADKIPQRQESCVHTGVRGVTTEINSGKYRPKGGVRDGTT
jgi:hypothetical protein